MNKRSLLLILLVIALFFSSCAVPTEFTSDEESVEISGEAIFHFIDVGQGDSILIQGGGKNILIDAGPQKNAHKVFEYLKNAGIKHLDYFIGTHPHEDHLGGAASVLGAIDVSKVFLNGENSTGYFFEKFIDVLTDKNITPQIPDKDCIYELGPFRIKFLSPKKDFGNTNDNSLVFTIQFGDIKALFTGDAERNVESELLKDKKLIDSDILKVSHHGSRYASSLTFLKAVTPAVCVIQCGEGNSYEHPHSEAVERLNKFSSEVFRTDKDNNVVLTTDGKTIKTPLGGGLKSIDSSSVELVYIGNKKSRVFHCEACPNLPSEKNSVFFKSREDAINSGYKICGNCNP